MRFFGDNLRTAWDILLELYAVQLGGRKTSLPELAQATEAPAPTVRRWVPELDSGGWQHAPPIRRRPIKSR